MVDLILCMYLFFSYGSRWGMDGYMHMVRNKNMCGIAMDAAYPIL